MTDSMKEEMVYLKKDIRNQKRRETMDILTEMRDAYLTKTGEEVDLADLCIEYADIVNSGYSHYSALGKLSVKYYQTLK